MEDLNAEKRDFREKDEVDEYLNEQREEVEKDEQEEEEIQGGESNLRKFRMREMQDAVEYPSWMSRIAFVSKILPTEPSMIGDAQPDLIKILLLQMGEPIQSDQTVPSEFLLGRLKRLGNIFRRTREFRIDLDPKVPYLGEDDDGKLIEPTDEQMRELYRQVGNPNSKEDIGEDGFVHAYHGSLIFKRLVIYILECGYGANDLQDMFGGEQFEGLNTPEEEAKKTLRARESLEIRSTFIRRVLGEAYGVNAVYFSRNVNYLNTVTLDAVDILCACRPQVRRIAVMHLILQNGRQLPRPLIIRLFDAIDDYNNSKHREHQRPKWGLHMTEAHVMAIADTPVPPDLMQETAASAKAKAKAKPAPKHPPGPSAAPGSMSTSSTSSVSSSRASSGAEATTDTTTRTRWERPRERTRIAAVIGTTLDPEADVGHNPRANSA